jgi:hypothetical protein
MAWLSRTARFSAKGRLLRPSPRKAGGMMEILTFSSTPNRLMRLINRVRAITLAEEGADFMDIFYFFRRKDWTTKKAIRSAAGYLGAAQTACRLPKTSPIKGFVLTYNFMRLAVSKANRIVFPCFCGKTMLEDMKVLVDLVGRRHGDSAALPAAAIQRPDGAFGWLSFSRFMSSMSFRQLEQDYANVL